MEDSSFDFTHLSLTQQHAIAWHYDIGQGVATCQPRLNIPTWRALEKRGWLIWERGHYPVLSPAGHAAYRNYLEWLDAPPPVRDDDNWI